MLNSSNFFARHFISDNNERIRNNVEFTLTRQPFSMNMKLHGLLNRTLKFKNASFSLTPHNIISLQIPLHASIFIARA